MWSEGSGGDRSSRRALILQMAKARMKNNNNSPDKSRVSAPIQEEVAEDPEGSIAGNGGEADNLTEGNTDIDFSVDLD